MIALGTSVDFPAWAAIIVVVLGVVGTIGSAVAVFRQAAIKSTLEAQRLSMEVIVAANAELRKAYDDQKKELDAERVARALRLALAQPGPAVQVLESAAMQTLGAP